MNHAPATGSDAAVARAVRRLVVAALVLLVSLGVVLVAPWPGRATTAQ